MNKIVLTITLDRETGQVTVNGPIRDQLFCYGLLQAAKDSIRDYSSGVASNGGGAVDHITIGDFAEATVERRK